MFFSVYMRDTVLVPLKHDASLTGTYVVRKIMLDVLNGQSAKNKVDRIHDVIIEHDIDILTLTERWLTSARKDEFFVKSLAISGYKLYSVPRKGSKGYGGVAIMYKFNLKVNARSSANGGETFQYCEILFQNDFKYLNVIVMYRPPPSKKNIFTANMFMGEFNKFMVDHLDSAGELILVGDLNFHLDKPSYPESKKFLSLLESLHFTQNVSSATHRSGHMLRVGFYKYYFVCVCVCVCEYACVWVCV